MRALFLLLLLANVAFFGWNWYESGLLQQAGPGPAPSAPAGQGLRALDAVPADQLQPLRSSSPRQPDAATVEPEPPPQPQPVKPRCYRAGMIESKAVRDRLLAALAEQGVSTETGTEPDHGESHWVVLPPLPDQEAAERMMARLRSEGLEDLYRVPSGENAHAISLGVFHQRPRADERLARVRELGFDAEMRNLALPSTRYWVRFEWPGDRGPLPASLAETTGAELKPAPCR